MSRGKFKPGELLKMKHVSTMSDDGLYVFVSHMPDFESNMGGISIILVLRNAMYDDGAVVATGIYQKHWTDTLTRISKNRRFGENLRTN